MTGAFLDVSAAFDTVWHDGLLYKLKKTCPPDFIFRIVESFLSDRSFEARVNTSTSSRRYLRAGVPQGAILSPLLYILYCSDMPNTFSAELATFADDTALLSKSFSLEAAIETLQESIDNLSSWFLKWRLRLNGSKTVAKIFALRKFDPVNVPPLQVEGARVPWTPTDQGVRYLGVYFDTRLTWKLHTLTKLQQAHTRLTMLYPLINRNTPLRHKCITLLYMSLIRPILTYACPVWFGASNTNKRRLQSFQNKVLRMALNAPWFVRNRQIHRELGLPPLEEHLQDLIRRHHSNLALCEGASTFHIGGRSHTHRLKAKLYQDILL